MLSDELASKVRIVSSHEVQDALKEYIEIDQIPGEYGGDLNFSDFPESCRFQSPYEVRMREHNKQTNSKYPNEGHKGPKLTTPPRIA